MSENRRGGIFFDSHCTCYFSISNNDINFIFSNSAFSCKQMCLLNSVCNVHIERHWTGHRCRIIAIFNVLSIRNDNEISNIRYEVNVLILKNNRDKSRRLKLYSSLHCKASCTLPAGCTETRMLVFSSLNSEFSRLLPQSTATDFYIWVFSTIVIRNTYQKYKLKHTLRHHFVNKQVSFQLTKNKQKICA